MRRSAWLISMAWLTAGCGQSDPGQGMTSVDLAVAAPDLAPVAKVSIAGVRGTHWWNDQGDEEQDYDLTGTPFAAYVPDGKGGFDKIDGAAGTAGLLTVDNVPAGTVYLKYNDWGWFVTTKTTLDLVWDAVGKRGLSYARKSPTTLTFNVTGLEAWRSGDGTQLYSGRLGADLQCAHCNSINPPAESDTAWTDLSIDYSTARNPVLFDAYIGDGPSLYQFSPMTSTKGASYYAIVRAATFTPFAQKDGVAATLTGVAMPVPLNATVTLDWRRSAWDALRLDVNPHSVSEAQFIGVHAQPGGYGPGDLSNTLDLLYYNSGANAVNLDFGDMQFANPTGAGWGVVGNANASFSVKYTLPNTKSANLWAWTWISDELKNFSAKPVRPALSPPRQLTVNGMPAYGSLVVSQPAQLVWMAPTTGKADGYFVNIYHLVNQQGTTGFEYVAEIHTVNTSVWIPPELLIAGEAYAFRVHAVSAPGVDLELHPLRAPFPFALAGALTGMLTMAK